MKRKGTEGELRHDAVHVQHADKSDLLFFSVTVTTTDRITAISSNKTKKDYKKTKKAIPWTQDWKYPINRKVWPKLQMKYFL